METIKYKQLYCHCVVIHSKQLEFPLNSYAMVFYFMTKLCQICNSENIETIFSDGCMNYFCKDCNAYNGSAHNYISTGLKFRFGKYKGNLIELCEDANYLKWMLEGSKVDKGYKIAMINRLNQLK